MFALLGSLVGFLSSLAPDLFRFMRDQKDKAHELTILDKQMEMIKLGHATRMEEIQSASDSKEVEVLYRYADKTGVSWVDGFSGTVRPLLTYAFFALYAWIKICAFWVLSDHGQSSLTASIQIWSMEDQTIFSAIISFWFGQRAFKRKG